MLKLTEKQKRFCAEYIIDLNAAQAAIRAGYSEKTAKAIGSENLTKPDIKSLIAEKLAEIAENNMLKADDVINELKSLGFWNIQDYIGRGNTIKDISKLPRNLAKPIIGIKRTEEFFKGKKTVVTELKFVDKRSSLGDLGKYLGIFEKDNRQKAIKIGKDLEEEIYE